MERFETLINTLTGSFWSRADGQRQVDDAMLGPVEANSGEKNILTIEDRWNMNSQGDPGADQCEGGPDFPRGLRTSPPRPGYCDGR